MADVFTKQRRSQIMASIRSTGNRETEGNLAAIFRRHGVTGWRRHPPMPGKPDFAFRAERLAVFVDGCFWHGCPEHSRLPKSNQGYWQRKLSKNKERDARVTRELRLKGWNVVRLWQHDLRHEDSVMRRIGKWLARNGSACHKVGTENVQKSRCANKP